MSADRGTVTVRSFRLAFALERRIFRIERYRLPLPYGLPLRGIAYAAATLALVLALERVAVVGSAIGVLPWPVRYLVMPAAGAQALMGLRIDGRSAHQVAQSWVRWRIDGRPARQALRLTDVALVPDERGASFRPAVVRGPGIIVLRLPARFVPRRHELRVTAAGDRPSPRGQRIVLRKGQRVRT